LRPFFSTNRQRELELSNLAEKEDDANDSSADGGDGSDSDDDKVKAEGECAAGAAGTPTTRRAVARTFRYMRKRPTIIFYKPPEGTSHCNCN
jgi:hypothetical protein